MSERTKDKDRPEGRTCEQFRYNTLYDIPPASRGIIFEGVFVAKRKLFRYVYVFSNTGK